MTRRHHNEGGLSVPLCIRPPPLLGLHPLVPPQNFIMLPPLAQVNRRCCVLLSQTRPASIYIQILHRHRGTHVCAFNNIDMDECERIGVPGEFTFCVNRAPCGNIFQNVRWQHLGLSFRRYFSSDKDWER
ncbi:hypothetical protein CEXT_651131 [Caerostris extrusa]|uniref:Uncharacterized protein n=1 Tax=Caerostris extrusa TaxID=172846 RepID=A0AAV4T2R0_CAEEX|nr:hypothetical protein CEXT_651131 [Caerostris extrusa]